MTKFFVLFSSIIWLLFAVKPGRQKDNSEINIDFQYNFKNDTADIKINNVSILYHEILNSGPANFTNLSIKITRYRLDQYKIDYLDKYKYCSRSNKIRLVVKLNGKESLYFLDPRNGRWVGLGKDNYNKIVFTQQHNAFIYD